MAQPKIPDSLDSDPVRKTTGSSGHRALVVLLIVLLTDLQRNAFVSVHALQGIVFGGARLVSVSLDACLTVALTVIVPLLGCVLWIGFSAPRGRGFSDADGVQRASRIEFGILSEVTCSLVRQPLARS